MDAEEEEPRHASSVESSLRLEDKLETTASASDLLHENTESHCEVESVADLDESGQPASSALSPIAEKEEEGKGKDVVDVEVLPGRELEAAVGDEEGGEDLIGREEKHKMWDAGDEIKASSPVAGDKECEGVADEDESHLADEKDDVVEDAESANVMEEMEKADVSDERGTSEGIEVVVEKQQVAELAEEAGNLEQKKMVDDVQDQIDITREKEAADVVEERGIAEAAVVDGVTQKILVSEETGAVQVMEERGIAEGGKVDDVTEQTVVMEEIGVADVLEERAVAKRALKREILMEKPVANEREQTGIMEKPLVDNMAEKSELLEEKPVVDLAGRPGIVQETVVTDMIEKAESLEEKLVLNVTEQTENPKDINAVRETGTDMAEVAKDTVMGEESEKAEDIEYVVEDFEKTEGTETEMGDAAEGMEAGGDTEMLNMTEELEPEAAEEMEETDEIEDGGKANGGKRKRGKNLNSKVLGRAPSGKKMEEDVCFICFDGGDLVLCDRRGCPKAYHTACVGRDEAFFRARGKWNCGLIYMIVKLAEVGFSEGTGSSISSFFQAHHLSFACFSNWFNGTFEE